MIPQPFIKGAGERVFFGPYEYPSGADLVFDFGNPLCTSAWGSNIVYNVGSANVTASLVSYNNPGPFYPTLTTDYGGTATFKQQSGTSGSYMQWDWKSTEQQTNVFVYQPSGSASTGQLGYPRAAGANSLYTTIDVLSQTVYTGLYNSSNVQYDSLFGTPVLDTGSSNGRNGWNTLVFSADGSNSHYQYINLATSSFDNTTITRVTSGTQTTRFPQPTSTYSFNAGSRIMAFLQYPKILTPKEIRQINRLFAQRFFT